MDQLVRIGYVDDPHVAEIYAANLRSEGIKVTLSGGVAMYPTRVGFGSRTYLMVPTEEREDAVALLEGSDMVAVDAPDAPSQSDWVVVAAIGVFLVLVLLATALR